jgi:hypothetical protein
MSGQLGPNLAGCIENYASRASASKESVKQSEDQTQEDRVNNFRRDINSIFRGLPISHPHERLSVLWNELQEELCTQNPGEYDNIQNLLSHGSLPYVAPKASENKTSSYSYRQLGNDEIRLVVLYPAESFAQRLNVISVMNG